jgi:hypothetical protein
MRYTLELDDEELGLVYLAISFIKYDLYDRLNNNFFNENDVRKQIRQYQKLWDDLTEIK